MDACSTCPFRDDPTLTCYAIQRAHPPLCEWRFRKTVIRLTRDPDATAEAPGPAMAPRGAVALSSAPVAPPPSPVPMAVQLAILACPRKGKPACGCSGYSSCDKSGDRVDVSHAQCVACVEGSDAVT